jgi:hypothetical protein
MVSAVIAQTSCIRQHLKMSHLPAGALLMFGHIEMGTSAQWRRGNAK